MSGCTDCEAGGASEGLGGAGTHPTAGLRRLGLSVPAGHRTVALAGNPNTGKTTLFNALTGLRQHVGNWPGTTVTRTVGGYLYGGKGYRVLDLPGAYSLDSASPDEEVARDALFVGSPDVTVVVVDATRLAYGLPLVLQVRELALRTVVALNLIDAADRDGIRIDVRHLRRELDAAVVPIAARQGRGLPELMRAIARSADGEPTGRAVGYMRDPDLIAAVASLAVRLREQFPGLVRAEWVARRLIEGDPAVRAAVLDGSLGLAAMPPVPGDDPSLRRAG